MKNISGIKKAVILFVVLLFPGLLYLVLSTGKHNMMSLKIYGPRDVKVRQVDGKEITDTIYHTIPDFEFTNQYGEAISRADVKDQVKIVDFFFTSCQGICLKMTNQMTRVQEEFKNKKDVVILSHTVDPERDSVPRMKAYAEKYNAQQGKWHFLTGEKKPLYDIARHGYYVTAMEGDGGPDDFIHSEKFVLVDKEGRIRGFYDGTKPAEVDRLMDEVKVLLAEEQIPRKGE